MNRASSMVSQSIRCGSSRRVRNSTWFSQAPFLAVTRAASSAPASSRTLDPTRTRAHFVFGANTDVGKTLVSAGLVQASASAGSSSASADADHVLTSYVKPLQCGGSDQAFVERHTTPSSTLEATTIFRWETPTSPHAAARIEDMPVSNDQVQEAFRQYLDQRASVSSTVWIETAGGVLSPSSSSPANRMIPTRPVRLAGNVKSPHESSDDRYNDWGWIPQAQLYRKYNREASVVLVGDGRLGGISATLTALESLLARDYVVDGIVFLETDFDNQSALREYASWNAGQSTGKHDIFTTFDPSIFSLPTPPPEPEPLFEWYETPAVKERLISFNEHLSNVWRSRHA